MFSEFEKDMVEQYNLVFGTKYTITSVTFLDIPNVKTDAQIINNAPIEKEAVKTPVVKQTKEDVKISEEVKNVEPDVKSPV